MFGSGTIISIISNEEMNNIMKTEKFLEESGLLIKGVSKAIKNEAEEQKGGFLGMLLGTSGTSLLGNLSTVKSTIRAGEGTIRAGQDFWCCIHHPLTNFDIQMYYQKKPKFSGVYSRNNLPNIKNGPRVINLDQLKSIGTHCIALYVNGSNRRTSCSAMYFASFAVAHIPKEI